MLWQYSSADKHKNFIARSKSWWEIYNRIRDWCKAPGLERSELCCGALLTGIKGGVFSAEPPLIILPSILSSFVHLLLPSLVWPFTPPWRLQLLLEEREREEREEVVEEVDDARFVRASTLLLPFPSSASPNPAFYFLPFFIYFGQVFPHLEWDWLP